MQTLDDLYSWQTAPVDRIDVPNTNGAHDTADTVSKQTNRDRAEDDSNWLQRQAVEDVLSSEDLTTGSSDRC